MEDNSYVNSLISNIHQNILFCVQHETHTGLDGFNNLVALRVIVNNQFPMEKNEWDFYSRKPAVLLYSNSNANTTDPFQTAFPNKPVPTHAIG